MPSSLHMNGIVLQDHDNDALDCMSVQSVYTVNRNSSEMSVSKTSVFDLLKFNLMNSRRKKPDSFNNTFDITLGQTSDLNQRSRLDVISKSLGTMRGLPKRRITRPSINSDDFSMDGTLRAISNHSTMKTVSKYDSTRQRKSSLSNSGSGTALQGEKTTVTPHQQTSSSTLISNSGQYTIKKMMLTEIEAILNEHNAERNDDCANRGGGLGKNVVPNDSSTNTASTLTNTASNRKVSSPAPNAPIDLDVTTTGATSSNEIRDTRRPQQPHRQPAAAANQVPSIA